LRFAVPDDFPPVYRDHMDALEPLRASGEVQVYGTRAADVDELVARLRDVAAVINVRAYTKFDAALLDRVPELRMISVLGTGTDNIDLDAATARGVVVSNVPGASTVSVAECSIALLFDAAKHVSRMDRAMRAGEWKQILSVELRGRTLGLVGLGAIGQEVARMGRALGMRVVAWSMTRDEQRARDCGAELVELDELLAQSDFVSLHLRASPQTAGMLGREQLQRMKRGSVLVNTARGAIVDTDALVEALRSGPLAAAGLDVYPQEPLPADSPLRELDNVVLLPHTAWVTEEASDRLRRIPVDNILAWLDGSPASVVNPKVLG
jgi:phosphoglycerate dehydrogenase-like enzyme